MQGERNYDGRPDVEKLNETRLGMIEKMRTEQNENSNRLKPFVKKGVSLADDFCGNSVTELQNKIAVIIKDNTLPNDFGLSTLKEQDILTIAKEIEDLLSNENKGIDHAISTLRDQVKNNGV